MKKSVKNLSVLFFMSLGLSLYAQNQKSQDNVENPAESGDEELTLPDVSTVIYGGSIKAGKSAIPDYTEVLPQNAESSGEFTVQLPDSGLEDAQAEKAEIMQKVPEKQVFVEGVAGCGVPGFFTGNFTVYRQSGNPFKINFGHESSAGYAGKSLNDGYFDRFTSVSGEKTFAWKTSKLNLSCLYSSYGNGLQEKCESITDVSKENLSGAIGFNWKSEKGLVLDAGLNGSWYKRFGNLSGSSAEKDKIPVALAKVSIVDVTPAFLFGWHNKGFKIDFNADYGLEADVNGSFDNDKNRHRGTMGLNFGWNNSTVNLFAKGGVVLGNKLNDNSVSVPFAAGCDFTFVTGLSPRNMLISLSGGCDSYAASIGKTESYNVFSAVQDLLTETSDWYGKISLGIPVKNSFSFVFDGEFRKTAFGNGVWTPDYDADDSVVNKTFYGQYAYVQKDMTQVNTNAGISFRAGAATFSANWKASWGDKPALQYKNYVNVMVSVQPASARFGIDGSIGFTPDSDEDNVPDVDFSVFFRVTQSVRLAVSADDIVKLVSAGTRKYAGQYIRRSGNAALLVKFTF